MSFGRTLGVSLAASLLLALLVFIPQSGDAAELRAGNQPLIATGETVREDVYIAGGSVSSAGVVAADLIAAGGNVLVRGNVGADLAAAGGSVTVLGNVADDVRAVGGNLLLQGAIGGDAVLAGGQITVGGKIAGDLLVGGGTGGPIAPLIAVAARYEWTGLFRETYGSAAGMCTSILS